MDTKPEVPSGVEITRDMNQKNGKAARQQHRNGLPKDHGAGTDVAGKDIDSTDNRKDKDGKMATRQRQVDVSSEGSELVVARSGDNLSLEFVDEKVLTSVVNLKPSGNTHERKEDMVEERRLERREGTTTRVSADTDRRGMVLQDSFSVYSHGDQSNGTMDKRMLDMKIQKTKEKFVETKTYAAVDKMLMEKGHATLMGAPGEGKTSLALMLGSKYNNSGYGLIFVNDITKFRLEKYLGLDKKFFFIFDDIFGTVGLSSHVLQVRRTLHDLKLCLEDTTSNKQTKALHKGCTVRVIFTTKSSNLEREVLRIGALGMFFFKGQTVVDLTEMNYFQYSLEEKEKIFKKHKVNNQIKVDFRQVYDAAQTTFGFPLTCQLFFQFNAFQANPKAFFKNPLVSLQTELENILAKKDERSAALVLMLLCDDKMDLTHVKKEFKNTPFDKPFRSLQSMIPNVAGTAVVVAARNFQGTYFTTGSIIGFLHPTIYDACAYALYNIAPRFLLENCSQKFLHERIRDTSMKPASMSDHLHSIYVSDAYNGIIAKRLAQAIEEGNYSMSITHRILTNEEIVNTLFDLLQMQKAKIFSQENAKQMLVLAMQAHSQCLIQRILAIGCIFSDTVITDAFDACASCGNLSVMKFLMSKFKSIKQYTVHEALATSTENSDSEMVKYLLRCCDDVTSASQHTKCNVLITARENKNVGIEKDIISSICRQRRISRSCNDSNELLHIACRNGDVKLAKYVLPVSGINIPVDGLTPVMIASFFGQSEVFDMLVSKGADLTRKNNQRDTVLHLACVGGNKHIVEHLLPLFDINIRGQERLTPVMKAAVSGQKDVFELLVSKGADLKLTDNNGNNVLHCACCSNNANIVKHLLTMFDINTRGHIGWTPVMRAAYNGQKDALDLLVSKGADLTLTDNIGNSVLHWACCSDSVSIVEQLLPRFDINIRGYNGLTPLMHSASHGQRDTFNYLLSKGADLLVNDNNGNTVFHWACCGCCTVIVEQLIPKFNINARGQNGFTPVMNAACHGQQEVYFLLVSKGADLSMTNTYGSNLLHSSSVGGNTLIVEHLLPLFDINDRGRNSMTPVMVAAMEGRELVFDFLVEKGADLTLTDADGKNPLHHADKVDCPSIFQSLSTSHL